MSFFGEVKKFRIESIDLIRDIKRAAVFQLFSAIVMETPVREGVLRGSWWPTVDIAHTEDINRADTSGSLTVEQIRRAVAAVEMGERVYLTNRQPYAARIEFEGWSGLAPQGMVRVNAARWNLIVRNTARELSR